MLLEVLRHLSKEHAVQPPAKRSGERDKGYKAQRAGPIGISSRFPYLSGMKLKISTRLVLVIGEVAIKFPLGRRGYLQGKNEKDLYSRYAATGMLAPLKWERLGITCLQRCELATVDYGVSEYISTLYR